MEADHVRKLSYMMNASLDGYIAAPGDDIGWSVPSPELHQWFNDRAREIGLSLYGRRLWELMSAHWPTADQQPDTPPVEVEFAHLWQRTPKVVFSTTLDEVDGNARLVTGDAVAEIRRLKAEDGAPMEIGGAGLAGTAMRAGLIDEYQVVTHPVLVGGGTPFFSALDSWVNLRHVGTQDLPDGVTAAHYEVRR
nr:dihydrofolate reductase family protein [Nocardioides ochotonae]